MVPQHPIFLFLILFLFTLLITTVKTQEHAPHHGFHQILPRVMDYEDNHMWIQLKTLNLELSLKLRREDLRQIVCDVEPTADKEDVLLKCEPDFPEMAKKGVVWKCNIGNQLIPSEDPEMDYTEKKDKQFGYYERPHNILTEPCYVEVISLKNGKINKNHTPWEGVLPPARPELLDHGTELRFECTEPGFEMYVGEIPVNHSESNDNFIIRNCNNGRWSGPMPVCKPARCLCSNLTAQLTEKGLETTECEVMASSGDFIQMQCTANYCSPQGPLIAECQLGVWKPFETTCLKMCSCDDLRENLTESLAATCDGNVSSGDFVDLECSQGYVNSTEDSAAECMEGLWLMNDTYCNVPSGGLKRDCSYKSSSQVQAFFQGSLLIHNSSIPHLANISLRCSNVQNLKFVGKKQLQCIDGKFDSPMPECFGLLANSPISAPPLWLTTTPADYPKVDEIGVVVIPRQVAISITCWYSDTKPDITIESSVPIKSQKRTLYTGFAGWATVFDPYPNATTLNYSCGVPGKTPKENLTQYLQIKIADTCRLNENRIEAIGLLVDPTTKRYLYAEGDQVDLICGGLVENASPYMTCKQGGRWERAPKIDCPTEGKTTEAES